MNALCTAVALWLAVVPAAAAGPVTPPKEHFGFNLGDDYCLANYRQLLSYWKKLETESDRLKVVTIGTTEEGRPQVMAVVTSPANHRTLDRYRDIARRLAQADGVTADEARSLAAQGKAVVWIDAGLHATETLCAQMMIETVYQLVTGNDSETGRVLEDVIILFVHANPDGHDLVANWYMRHSDPKKRSMAGLPRLYQKYAGHDNNRDFYAGNLAETRNMNRVMYREWFPQIVYNHHQSGPAGTVMFCPPFRDPFNYNVDPLVVSGIDAVGAAMMQRFLAESKPGVTTRGGGRYSTWWNGGLRTTCYFHNMIGLLTETVGSPTPMTLPYRPELQLPRADYLAPVAPQRWHFRQSVDYSVTANKAVLDYASRNREHLLLNIWRMGRAAIDRGSRDSWTVTPSVVEAAKAARGAAGRGRGTPEEYARHFRDSAKRDPRDYIIPADQPDFPTATKFVNALIGAGITVHRATADFRIKDKTYLAGSFVVNCSQAFRSHVLDCFEPQDHPNDFSYPGGPPIPPYDIAGWTLAFQMGIRFDRLLDAFEGPFEVVTEELPPPPAQVTRGNDAAAYFLDTRLNDAFRAVNRLLAAGAEVRRLHEPVTINGTAWPAGTFSIPEQADVRPTLEKLAAELGTPFVAAAAPPGQALPVKPVRIGLWDRYGGSMPSGWTRLVLERFEYPYRVVFPPELDQGGLRDKFDLLIFVDGAVPPHGTASVTERRTEEAGDAPPPADGNVPGLDDLPAEYRGRRGSVTAAKTIPELRKFVEAGGTLLAIGGSTSLAGHFGLPVTNYLTEGGKPLLRDKFYVPGSVLRATLDTAHPLAWGMDDEVDMMFAASPTFRLPVGNKGLGLRPVAWYDTKSPLRSGWAWGQERLDGGVAVVDAQVGAGRLVLYGPQVLFRAQPHGTFKLVFNAISRAGSGTGVGGLR